MLKRLWRFLVLLSVTPIMTVVCVVVLTLIITTCDVAPIWSRRLSVFDYRLQWLSFELDKAKFPVEPLGKGTGSGFYVIVDKDDLSIEKSSADLPSDKPVLKVELVGTPQAVHGFFATTHYKGSVDVSIYRAKHPFDQEALRKSIAARLRETWRFAHLAESLERGWFADTHFILHRGHAINVLAAGTVMLLLWSLQWLWRGARMPWGTNRAWLRSQTPQKIIAIIVISLVTPLSTIACAAVVWQMPKWMPLDRSRLWPDMPRTGNFETAQLYRETKVDLASDKRPSDDWEWDSVVQSGQPYSEVEREVLNAWNGYVIIGANRNYGWFAPMYHPQWTMARFHPTPQTLEQTKVLHGIIQRRFAGRLNPATDPVHELFVVRPARILWRGIVYNLALIGVFVATLASLQWIVNGVVWPWHFTRLRQHVCSRCKYSLEGLRSDTCPECGTALPLRTAESGAAA